MAPSTCVTEVEAIRAARAGRPYRMVEQPGSPNRNCSYFGRLSVAFLLPFAIPPRLGYGRHLVAPGLVL
jgi:hypothetical protein